MALVNRRAFLQRSLGAAAAVAGISRLGYGEVPPETVAKLIAAQRRPLGRTGILPSRLGVGTGTKAWNKNSAQIRRGRDVFLGTLKRAYERGIRYYDLADMYGSHEYLRDAVKEAGMDRAELVVLTKSTAKTAEAMRADLDRMRQEAGTDYFDIVLLHCVTEEHWPEAMSGCMDVLAEAKAKGTVRAYGVSCHHLSALKTAAAHPWAEVILARCNPFGTLMDGTPDEVLPVLQAAHDAGKGVIGMKIFGEGKHIDEKEACLRYALERKCLDAFTIGFTAAEELDEVIDLMDSCAA